MILAALYILLMYQRTMQGPPARRAARLRGADAREPVRADGRRRGPTAVAHRAAPRSLRVLDLDRRELAVVTPLVALIIVLGVYPQPLLNLIEPAVSATMSDLGGSAPMIEAPDLSLAALAPLLFVFGAACVGVLVEAFAPRDVAAPRPGRPRPRRHPRRAGHHAAAGRHPRGHRGRRARRRRRRPVPAGDDRRAGRAGDPAVRRAVPRPGPVGVRGVGRGARRAARATASCSPPSGCRPRSTR